MRKDQWIFTVIVFILMNLASIGDGDFFNWKMNIAFVCLIAWIYLNKKL